jgi:hypothetical protein
MKTQRRKIGSILVSFLLFGSVTVHAQNPQGTAIAGKFGTTGWGFELIQSLNQNLNLRFGLNRYTGNYDGEEDNVIYDLDVKLRSGFACLDWYPYEGEFRVIGGLVYNGNTATLLGRPTGSISIGDNRYPPDAVGELRYEVEFRKIAPYLGIGIGNATRNDRRFSFMLDVGLIFQGAPDIELSADDGWLVLDREFQRDLQKEEEQLEEDLRMVKFYPVLAVGFTYRLR